MALKQLSIRFWIFSFNVFLGMCQSPHSLTAGERYSLFQLTAGLSPTTGEHAGKWVTVNTVWLPHICFTSALSTPRICMTPWQRTKAVSKCATLLQKSLQLFCRVGYREITRVPLHCCHVSLVRDCSGSDWKHYWWSRGWWVRPAGWWFSGEVNTRVMKQDWGTLLEAIRAISKMKKTPRINVCVLCWEAWFTHMAAEGTCWIKGDSVVVLEHNCWIWVKGW